MTVLQSGQLLEAAITAKAAWDAFAAANPQAPPQIFNVTFGPLEAPYADSVRDTIVENWLLVLERVGEKLQQRIDAARSAVDQATAQEAIAFQVGNAASPESVTPPEPNG